MSFEPISDEQMITIAGGVCGAAAAPATSNRIRGGRGLGAGAGAEGGATAGAGNGAGCQELLGALQSLLSQFGLGGMSSGASAGPATGTDAAGPASRAPRAGAADAAGGCACGGSQ